MTSVLTRTTVGACLAAVPVFVPTAVSPADLWRQTPATAHTAVALPPTRYAAAQVTRYVVAEPAADRKRPAGRSQRSHASATASSVVVPGSFRGLAPPPAVAVTAYQSAAAVVDGTSGCNLSWTVLAAIGEVESQHAASGGGRNPGWDGVADPPILGPVLDGRGGTRAIGDTDGGRLDGNARWDRAVGPMQFLPGTWATFGVDGDGDGRADPQNIRDAALTAAGYLCHAGTDLADPEHLAAAVYSYNHADWYVSDVLSVADTYASGSTTGIGPAGVVNAAIAFAYAHLGDPYLWGGTGPLYDCSGFTQAAYARAGVTIPRTSEEQWLRLPHVDDGQLRAGDLVFFNPGEFRPGLPGHVGIYLGNGYMIDDPHTGATVSVRRITGAGQYVGAARPGVLAGGGPSMPLPTPTGGLPVPAPGPSPQTGRGHQPGPDAGNPAPDRPPAADGNHPSDTTDAHPPKADRPGPDPRKAGKPTPDEPKADQPKADHPKPDQPKAAKPKRDKPGRGTPGPAAGGPHAPTVDRTGTTTPPVTTPPVTTPPVTPPPVTTPPVTTPPVTTPPVTTPPVTTPPVTTPPVPAPPVDTTAGVPPVVTPPVTPPQALTSPTVVPPVEGSATTLAGSTSTTASAGPAPDETGTSATPALTRLRGHDHAKGSGSGGGAIQRLRHGGGHA